MRLDKYFLLNWKKVLIVAGAWVLAVLLHNAIYALFFDYFSGTGSDEPVFFLLATVVIPLYAVIAGGYTLLRIIRRSV